MKKLLIIPLLLLIATMLNGSQSATDKKAKNLPEMAKSLPEKEQKLVRIIIKNDRVINCKIDVIKDIAIK